MQSNSFRALSCVVALATSVALTGCSVVHEPVASSAVDRGQSSAVAAQIDYARAHFKNPNRSEFGDLGGTDCVNFTSQTLLARGWKMTPQWSFTQGATEPYSRAWISSTAFRDYLDTKPQLATPLSWEARNKVAPGDVVQFDWDNSGDRDHTAVISGITTDAISGERVLLVTSHSPAAFDWPIDQVLSEHGDEARVFFWHLSQ